MIDSYSQGAKLSDTQVQAIVKNAISSYFGADSAGIYIVLTSSDVAEKSGFCSTHCGWHVPAGLVGKQVPSGRYAVLASEAGPPMQVVPKLWQRIWAMSSTQLGGSRSFVADYELYDGRPGEPVDARVHVYVGLR